MNTQHTPDEKPQPATLLAAMAKHGITVKSEFVPFSQSRYAKEKTRSLNWRVTLQRAGRDIITTDYMAGIGHCPAYKASVRELGGRDSIYREPYLIHETETGKIARTGPLGMRGGAPILPSAADVMHSLLSDASALDEGTFENWASSFGYDADSRKAEAIWRACVDIGLKLRAGLGEIILAELREAAEGF